MKKASALTILIFLFLTVHSQAMSCKVLLRPIKNIEVAVKDDSMFQNPRIKNSEIEVVFVEMLLERYSELSPLQQARPANFNFDSPALTTLAAKVGTIEGDYRKLLKKFLLSLVMSEVKNSPDYPFGMATDRLTEKLNIFLNTELAAEEQRLSQYQNLFNQLSSEEDVSPSESVDYFLAIVSVLKWPILKYL